MSRRVRTVGSLVVFLAALTFFVGRVSDGPSTTPESHLDRAHRLCGQCGLETHEVDMLIANSRHATLTREQQVELFEATYTDPSKLEEARELFAAILDRIQRLGVPPPLLCPA